MKVISVRKERILTVLYLAVIIAVIATEFRVQAVETFSMPVSKKVVVIDAGHGGWDPGKIGLNNTLEKDINLLIAEKLQAYLEQGGSVVFITRSGDEALSDKKREDLRKRKELANTSKADLFISIHQNSYPSESVKGAQVFYYGESDESKVLAEKMQNEIKSFLGAENSRIAKANSDYYVLKKTLSPAVLVECGFLSNYSDTKKLLNDEYQEKMAWAIYMGIVNYFNDDEGIKHALK